MDCSIENIWRTWKKYSLGKKKSNQLLSFQENLETNLFNLSERLASGVYQHGAYRTFRVTDNKLRIISVASIEDRIVHRLIYDYLVLVYDKHFDFDVWSCRKKKGLIAGVRRAQYLVQQNEGGYFWRSGVRRYFESIDKAMLYGIIKMKIKDKQVLWLIKVVLKSFSPGISIGNLTSQIFANIYLNEFDRFVRNQIKPRAYIRYGDDFVIFDCEQRIQAIKVLAKLFLEKFLHLSENQKNDYVGKLTQGVKFLGCRIYSDQIVLNKRNQKRIFRRMNQKNVSSYYGLIKQFGNTQLKRKLAWGFLKHT